MAATGAIDRRAFIQRWRDRAQASDDPVDQFFSAWIALVVCARPHLRPEDHDLRDTDRRAVLRLSESCRDAIFREIDSQKEELAWLARRKGTHRQDPIVDVYDFVHSAEHFRDRFRRLADHYSGERTSKPGLVVEAVIELLNHVRNNLFHGIKDPDDVDDRDLLRRLNPILHAVLRGSGS